MDETYERLLTAIKAHGRMEESEIADVVGVQRGADAGYPGFTYTKDGAEFYRANDDDIDELLQEDADSFGQSVAEMIAGFGRADMAETRDGRDCLLAWYALEKVSSWLQDRREVADES